MRNAMRQGFTLLEMLVTLILLGILVAVVFPVVTQQIDDADPTKAANDLANIRTGIEIFHLNVRPTYPGDLEDLSNEVTAGDSYLTASTSTTAFSAETHVPKWNGPYIDKAILAASSTGDVLQTGFGGNIQSELIQFDATNNVPFGGGGYSATSDIFVAVQVHDLDGPQAAKIDGLIDGSDTPDSGQIRFVSDVLYYLAVPLK